MRIDNSVQLMILGASLMYESSVGLYGLQIDHTGCIEVYNYTYSCDFPLIWFL